MDTELVIPKDIILTRHAVDRFRKYYAQIHRSIDDKVGCEWIKVNIFPYCKAIPIERMRNWQERAKRHPCVIYFLHEPTMIVFAVDVFNKCIKTCLLFTGSGSHTKPKSREGRAAEKRKVHQVVLKVLCRREIGEEEIFVED